MHFVDGWSIAQVLGEGAFGEVKLLVNDETQEAVAVKTLRTPANSEADLHVKKEIAVHKPLNHPHIVKYFGHRTEGEVSYIFLEYAAGGELFDRIEPDVGMDMVTAQRYFVELVAAVEYLHGAGVTHRDIKPENILLSEDDHIKLSDFGMATMFRNKKGVERVLDKKCGTMPYVAPEVLLRPYRAPPADVWSCGIVLVAMLAGELPWDSPSKECPEFVSWRDGNLTLSPWCKLDTLVLSLLRKVLAPLPDKRPSAATIPTLRWCRYAKQASPTGAPPAKRINLGDRICLTQPLPIAETTPTTGPEIAEEPSDFCFSQPVVLDNLLLSSQLHATQTTCAPVYQRLVKRMTRLSVAITAEKAQARIAAILEELGCTVKASGQCVTVSGSDRRRSQFAFKVYLLNMDGKLLLDFRLSKGDGLEFKKLFLKAKAAMSDVVIRKNEQWLES